MEWNSIGVVTKPQALKGGFRVKPSLLNLKKYKKMGIIKIDSAEYEVESVSIRDTFVIFNVRGIDTCEDAERLRGKEVFAKIEIDGEEHFDLIDFEVLVDNKSIGRVISIDNYGSKDILSVSGGQNLMLPIIDGLVEDIDTSAQIIKLNKTIMEQVAVYED